MPAKLAIKTPDGKTIDLGEHEEIEIHITCTDTTTTTPRLQPAALEAGEDTATLHIEACNTPVTLRVTATNTP